MFAVFGINETKARQMAIKKTPKTTGKGKQQRALTPEEYRVLLEQNTTRYLQQMKPVILSPEYATPETCQQFIQMAVQGGGDTLFGDDQSASRAKNENRPHNYWQKLDALRLQ